MLKFKSYPPTKGEDIQLSDLSKESVGENVDNELDRRQLGKSVGGLVMANVTDQNLGNVINILNEFALATEDLDDWTNRIPFLHGALEGALEEADASQRRIG